MLHSKCQLLAKSERGDDAQRCPLSGVKRTFLQLKLLRVNSALRLKTVYAERLEYLLHERSERIDELNGKLEQAAKHRSADDTNYQSHSEPNS